MGKEDVADVRGWIFREMFEHLEQRLVDRARSERCARLMVLALYRSQHLGRRNFDVLDNALDGYFVIILSFQ